MKIGKWEESHSQSVVLSVIMISALWFAITLGSRIDAREIAELNTRQFGRGTDAECCFWAARQPPMPSSDFDVCK